jgi:hypothetical protein
MDLMMTHLDFGFGLICFLFSCEAMCMPINQYYGRDDFIVTISSHPVLEKLATTYVNNNPPVKYKNLEALNLSFNSFYATYSVKIHSKESLIFNPPAPKGSTLTFFPLDQFSENKHGSHPHTSLLTLFKFEF